MPRKFVIVNLDFDIETEDWLRAQGTSRTATDRVVAERLQPLVANLVAMGFRGASGTALTCGGERPAGNSGNPQPARRSPHRVDPVTWELLQAASDRTGIAANLLLKACVLSAAADARCVWARECPPKWADPGTAGTTPAGAGESIPVPEGQGGSDVPRWGETDAQCATRCTEAGDEAERS